MSYFHHPKTQLFQPQYFNDNAPSNIFQNTCSLKSKPIAKVNPIESKKVDTKDESCQTDDLSNDIDMILINEDFKRSSRIISKIDMNSHKLIHDNYADMSSNQLKVKILEQQNLLKQQYKINSELKKLLIASMGDDLADIFSKLTSDVTELNDKVSDLLTERMNDQQNADENAIEAGLWRHKFLAGKVLLSETVQWKLQLEKRQNDSIQAIEVLLRERQLLRQKILESNSVLHQLVNILDCSQLTSIPSGDSSINLIEDNLHLSMSLQKSLLNHPQMQFQTISKSKYLPCINKLTSAENQAISHLNFQDTNPLMAKFQSTHQAFKVLTSNQSKQLENFTINFCKNCKGEIFLV